MKKLTHCIMAVCLLGVLLSTSSRPGVIAGSSSASNAYIGPYRVIAAANTNKFSPVIAYNSKHDEYLAVYEVAYSYHQIYGRRLSSVGVPLSSFLISDVSYPGGSKDRFTPAVAYDSIKDQYLVVWAYQPDGPGGDWDVYGRYLPWDAPAPALEEFAIVNSRADEYKPRVTFNTVNGDFLVVWLTDGTPDLPVEGTLAHSNGTYDLLEIANGGSAIRDFPDAAFNAGLNQYLVAWTVVDSTLDVNGVRLDSLGVPVSPGEIAIATSTSKEESHPAVAACARANQFLVAYQQTANGSADDDIFGSYLYGNGTLTGPFLVGGTTGEQGYPAAACDLNGSQYFVAWQDIYAPNGTYGITGEWLQPNNTTEDNITIIPATGTRSRRYPAVASGRLGSMVVWQHERDTPLYQDIWGVYLVRSALFLPVIKR